MKDNSFKKSTKKRALFYLNLRGGGCGSSTAIAPEPIEEGNDDDGMIDEQREQMRHAEATRQRREQERENNIRIQRRINRQERRLGEMTRRNGRRR
jgi:hypothetical protein